MTTTKALASWIYHRSAIFGITPACIGIIIMVLSTTWPEQWKYAHFGFIVGLTFAIAGIVVTIGDSIAFLSYQ